MPRGGKREGSGLRSTWKNGKTRTIRVPIALAKDILKLARELDDKGFIESVTESKMIDLTGIIVPEIRGKRFVFLSDLLLSGYEIHPFKWAELARAELRLTSSAVENQGKSLKR
ncbi:MAG: hypothetical protein ABI417_17480 [Coleofasciculaceae cyanobacterium]